MTGDSVLVPRSGGTQTLAMQFFDRVAISGDHEAFRYRQGDGWVAVTWSETADRVIRLAAGLLALGVTAEQPIGIASSTRYEWILADLANMCAGAATTTVYPSTNAGDAAYILADSESRIVFAEDEVQLAKLTARRAELPDLKTIVVFDGHTDGDWVITLADLEEIGAKHLIEHPRCVRDASEAILAEQLATLIYTSGTTGRPKGVRLSHRTWVYQGAAVAALNLLDDNDLQLLWLPMAHSFGKVLLSAQLACGFVSAIDGRVDRIVDNLAAVRPTFMGAAPRIFEKAHARIVTTQQANGGVGAKLFDAAFTLSRAVDARRIAGHRVPLRMNLQHKLFDLLVFRRIRRAFGGRIRFFVSGSAPLNLQIAEWFHAAGLLILEGYGLTETAGGGFINRPDNYKLGTVGLPFDGTSVRIGDQDEVQISGPCVMAGYHHMPEATIATFTADGWLRTGDMGALDADGFLTITGRIKDLFKTTGGKYIAPSAIEAKFMSLCPYASRFLVFGDARNYCVALITLDGDVISDWAANNGLEGASYSEMAQAAAVRQLVDGYVDQLNTGLNRWETIKKWALLDHDLTIESGELTPSLKAKRAVVGERYREVLDGLYTS
ncbi:long-chain fatty acid--CoA ligase [Mycolicibacterium peregrinum]|uniref:AMP-dependent synthetase/ligase n=3 Tax=Mycolicibacterium peregrinum TaxID=43304 RepID=UPI0006D803FD|nr:AMP-dependent synthetase/ligase [Mycolicibacterium peregrinum]MCV7204274.1 long-chain fatty acid--CoA ligase [Mycolicibacterium peregrinum]ORW50697.1 AMP-dependent synthetase [Mycolicibacterium peregrinum]